VILSLTAQWTAFGLFSLLAVMGGLGMATTMSMFRSGIFLMASFIGVAGLFILLSADLLGLLQIMMYIGGMLVMVMFMVLFMTDPGGSMMAGMKMTPVERLFSRGLTPRQEAAGGEEASPEQSAPTPGTASAPAHHDHMAMMRGQMTANEPAPGVQAGEVQPGEVQAEPGSLQADPVGAEAAETRPHPGPVMPEAQPGDVQTSHGMHTEPHQAESGGHGEHDHPEHPEGHTEMTPTPTSTAPPTAHAAMNHHRGHDMNDMAGMEMDLPLPVDHSAMNHGQGHDMMEMDMAMTTPVRPWGIVLGLTIAVGLVLLILLRPAWPTGLAGPLDPDAPRQIGNLLMSKYMLGFEGAGLLILLGIMGAAFIQQAGSHPSDPARAAYVTAEEPPAPISESRPLPGGRPSGEA